MKKRILKTIGAVAVTAMMTTTSFASDGISDSIKTAYPDNHIYSGHLITGITSSGTNSKPIAIRLSDDKLIPTKDGATVKQCVMHGDAKGDIATERFEIKINKITCNTSDDKQVMQDITGYVYGADGLNGVKAVLDSKKQVLTVSSGVRVDVIIRDSNFADPISNVDWSSIKPITIDGNDQKEAMNSAESYHKEMLIKTFSPEVEEELIALENKAKEMK